MSTASAVAASVLTLGGAALGDPASPTGPRIAWNGTVQALGTWTYGDSLSYRIDPRLTGGRTLTAASSTPWVCQVAHDDGGHPTGELVLLDVGRCTVSFHLDGGDGHTPYDAVVTRTVAPRQAIVTCQDFRHASDEAGPAPVPMFSNLAPWDSASDFTVKPAATLPDVPAGYYPVSVFVVPPVDTDTGSPRYQVGSRPCTVTVDPVLKVTGMPAGKDPGLTVDGVTAGGNRYVFPYGRSASYSLAPVLGGKATSSLDLQHGTLPEAWFASSATGTASGDTTVTYSTFGELVATSPFLDVNKRQFMDYTFHQYGWTAARSYLVDGFGGVSGQERLSRLRGIVTDLQHLIQNTVILYLGRTDYDAVKASGDRLVSLLQLILDDGGLPTS